MVEIKAAQAAGEVFLTAPGSLALPFPAAVKGRGNTAGGGGTHTRTPPCQNSAEGRAGERWRKGWGRGVFGVIWGGWGSGGRTVPVGSAPGRAGGGCAAAPARRGSGGSAPSFARKPRPGWAGSCCADRGRDGNQMVPPASAPPGRPLAAAAGLGPPAAPGPAVCIVSEKGRISELQLKTPSVSNESPIVFHNVFGRSLPANSFKP